MPKFSVSTLLIVTLVLGIPISLVSEQALADGRVDHNEAKRLREQGNIVPLQTILSKANNLHAGKVIEVELEKKRGRLIYEIELKDNKGIIWELKFNAKDASLISQEREGK